MPRRVDSDNTSTRKGSRKAARPSTVSNSHVNVKKKAGSKKAGSKKTGSKKNKDVHTKGGGQKRKGGTVTGGRQKKKRGNTTDENEEEDGIAVVVDGRGSDVREVSVR